MWPKLFASGSRRLTSPLPTDSFMNSSFDWLPLGEPDLAEKIGQVLLENALERLHCSAPNTQLDVAWELVQERYAAHGTLMARVAAHR